MAEKPSLAVLPFAADGHGLGRDSLADGITEDLITDLSKLPKLAVVSRHVSFAYKRTQKAPRKIAQDLGVRYLLEGSVRYAAARTRISAQLIDAVCGQVLWGGATTATSETTSRCRTR